MTKFRKPGAKIFKNQIKRNYKVSKDKQIRMLLDIEITANLLAKKCYKARKQLEEAAGPSPARKRGKVDQAVVVNITNKRRARIANQ